MNRSTMRPSFRRSLRQLAPWVAGLALVAFAGPLAAETLLTLERSEEGPNAKPSKIEIWIGDDRVSRADGRTTIVLERDQDELLVIDHQDESFSHIALPIDIMAMLPEDMKSLAAMFDLEVKVSSSEETESVGEWRARRHDLEITNPMGMAITSRLWMADIGVDLESFRDLAMSIATMQPGGQAVVDKIADLRGFPVRNETSYDLGGNTFRTVEELVSIDEASAPAAAFEPPKGYQKVEWDPLAALGGGM